MLHQTLQSIMAEDKSVLDMISNLASLQIELEPFDKLLATLKRDLRAHLKFVKVKPNTAGDMATELKTRLDQMISNYEKMEKCAGRDLFLNFVGLFQDLDQKVLELRAIFDTMIIPEGWHQITEVFEYHTLVKDAKALSIMDHIFLIERIETMMEFFSMCLRIALAFNGSDTTIPCDAVQLCKPFRKYLEVFIPQHLAGIGCLSVTLGMCSLLNVSKEESLFSAQLPKLSEDERDMRMYSDFIHTMIMLLEDDVESQKISWQIRLEGENIKMFQALLSSHHWLNEVCISILLLINLILKLYVHLQYIETILKFCVLIFQECYGVQIPTISRSAFLQQIRNQSQILSTWQPAIRKVAEDLKACTLVVLQRLKWGAGANPLLSSLLTTFEQISTTKRLQVENSQKLSEETLRNCSAILNYEVLRFNSPEATIKDQEFLQTVAQWEKVCQLERQHGPTISAIEEGLVQLLDPEGLIDHSWIGNVTQLIDDMINQSHEEIHRLEKGVQQVILLYFNIFFIEFNVLIL